MNRKSSKIRGTSPVGILLFPLPAFIILVVSGCASQERQIKPVVAEKPGWVESGKHPAYPDSLFILGIGLANLSGDAVKDRSLADANALAEITKQIKARVKVKDIHITVERVISGKSLEVTTMDSTVSASEIYSELVLQGLSFVQRHPAGSGASGLVYSLAVLDRRKAASALQDEIETLRAYHEACLTQADKLLNQHRYLRALWYLKEAGVTLNLGEERLAVARFVLAPLGLKEAAWMKPFGSPLASLNQAEAILSGLVLEKRSGENQKLSLGLSPQEPLTAGLVFQEDEARLPVEGALVRFAFQRGRGSLADSARTDRSGAAACTVYRLEPSTEPIYEISAAVDLSATLGNWNALPEAWQNLVRSSAKRVVFRLRLEIEAVENQAQLLALRLAEGLPEDYKFPLRVAVANLTYQDLRISSPFLRYFQEQISTHMSRLPQFQVIKPTELQNSIRTRSIAVTQKTTPDTPEGIRDFTDADAVLIGKCWEKGDSLLSVIAEIVQSSSKAALSSSDVVIRQDQIPPNLPLLPANYKDVQQNMAVWNDVASPNAKLEVKLWVDRLDGGVYEEGEKMKVYVWANKECYLYLIYRDVSGNELLIFPNTYRESNRIVGNTVYEIPSVSDRFEFTVVPPFGVEILKAFASTHPMPNLEGQEVKGGIKQLKLSLNKLAETLRGIEVRPAQVVGYPSPSGTVERAEASCVVTTVGR
jgi:hypothetical protein